MNERFTHKHLTLQYWVNIQHSWLNCSRNLSHTNSSQLIPAVCLTCPGIIVLIDNHYTRFSQVYHYPEQKVPAPEDKRKHREVIIFLCQNISLKLKLHFCTFVLSIFESLYISLHLCTFIFIFIHIFLSLHFCKYL